MKSIQMSKAAFISCFLGLLLIACAGNQHRDSSYSASAEDAYPHETLVDWVTYGDAAVVARVVREDPIPPSSDEIAAGEGLVMRQITVVVEETIWARSGAPTVPERFDFVAMGWGFRGDWRRSEPKVRDHSFATGDRLVFPAAWQGGGAEGGWSPLHHEEILSVDGGVVGEAVAGAEGPAIDAASRATTRELGARLTETKPDPLASRFGDLPPRERWRAVAAARRAQEPTTTEG